MSTYFDKKKLIDNNSDLFISDHDKSLSYDDLSGIIDAKRSYQSAKASGNQAAMTAANNQANAIRQLAGSYDGGIDGSEYNRTQKGYEVRINQNYSSPYASDKKKVLNLISGMGEFSYKPEKDPIFQIYRNLYTQLGEDAYDRALAENSLRTGGMVNSSAISAASQAQNKYNSMLAAKIPELYEAAYEKYAAEYDRLYRQLELLSDLDDKEYSRYRDKIDDFEEDRDYYYQKDKDSDNAKWKQYEFDTKLEYDIKNDAEEMAYKTNRDAIEDSQWREELDTQNNRDAVNSAINLAKILYGKVPVSGSVVNMLISMMK